MRKKLKSFTLVASTVASLAIILIACGKGELTNYFEADLNLSVEDFKGKCAGNAKLDSICGGDFTSYTPPPSSAAPQSSGGGTSSQGGGTSSQGGGTSSQGGGTSSQGGGGTSSQGGGTSSAAPPVTQSSSQAAQQGCPAINAKSGYKCGWDFKETNLTPGTRIKPEKTGGDDAGCTTKWVYKTGTSPLLRCSEMTSEGIISEGDKAYILYAQLDCGGTSYVNECDPTQANGGLTTKKAPYFDGECVWLSPGNDKPLVGNETSVNKGAKPSGVKLVDSANVCKDKTFEVKYDNNSKVWANSPNAGTYTDAQYVAKCAEYAVPVVLCPSLKVSSSMPDEVICVNKTGAMACTSNDKTISNSGFALSNSSEGCMDLTIDWQNADYPKGAVLNIRVGCEYKGKNGTSKTCKLLSGDKEISSVTTTNDQCRLDEKSIGTLNGVSNQSFKVCMKATEGGEEKDTGISCWLQIY